jgi:2-deoxy-D-gluconate 3-dehydrogenase
MVVPDDEYDLGTPTPFSLKGRHALVTGASGVLAQAIATGLGEADATVSVIGASNSPTAGPTPGAILDACRSLGHAGAETSADLTDPGAVEGALNAVEAAAGPVHILVNASHGANIKPVLDATVDDWRRELERNATCVFVACQVVGRRMVERGYGRIINLASVLHDRAVPNAAIFAASQGAVYGFTKSIGVEWGRSGVTANVLTLGFIDGVPGIHADPDIAAILERYIPLRRLGSPDDLKGAVVYMASDYADFLDSESITVDGAIQVHA